MAEKKRLGVEELESQVAFELPERELPTKFLITLIDGDVITINVRDVDVDVVLQLCAVLLSAGVIQRCQQRA